MSVVQPFWPRKRQVGLYSYVRAPIRSAVADALAGSSAPRAAAPCAKLFSGALRPGGGSAARCRWIVKRRVESRRTRTSTGREGPRRGRPSPGESCWPWSRRGIRMSAGPGVAGGRRQFSVLSPDSARLCNSLAQNFKATGGSPSTKISWHVPDFRVPCFPMAEPPAELRPTRASARLQPPHPRDFFVRRHRPAPG